MPCALACAMTTCLVASSGHAGLIREDVDRSPYEDLANRPEFAATGFITTQGLDGDFTASGTLLGSTWVLTAAHVVQNVTTMDFRIDGILRQASGWIVHPKYGNNLSSGYDLALVQLSAAINTVTPATRYRNSVRPGMVATFVGYGMGGDGIDGSTTPTGTKLAGMNVIDGLDARKRVAIIDFDGPVTSDRSLNRSGSPVPLDLEYMIAPGDSGGGMYIETPGGPMLAGLHSYGLDLNGNFLDDYGDQTGHTLLFPLNGWIDSVMNLGLSAFPQARYSTINPDPVVIPEPASVTIVILGFGLLMRRRLSGNE